MTDSDYFNQSLITVITVIIFIIIRLIVNKLTKQYGVSAHLSEHRTQLIAKYMDIFLFVLFFLAIIAIWGVKTQNLFVVMSSVFAVIGVALFAQWSILSNITSGVILFFSFPYRLGDYIKIHDKDFPIEAQIEDIKAFYTLLRTKEGEVLTYPNNLLLQKGVTILPAEQVEKEFFD